MRFLIKNGNIYIDVNNDIISNEPDLEIFTTIGDTITFVTVPEHRKYSYCIPIVFVSKDGETLLELEEGKENLIEWVNQLGLK